MSLQKQCEFTPPNFYLEVKIYRVWKSSDHIVAVRLVGRGPIHFSPGTQKRDKDRNWTMNSISHKI